MGQVVFFCVDVFWACIYVCVCMSECVCMYVCMSKCVSGRGDVRDNVCRRNSYIFAACFSFSTATSVKENSINWSANCGKCKHDENNCQSLSIVCGGGLMMLLKDQFACYLTILES